MQQTLDDTNLTENYYLPEISSTDPNFTLLTRYELGSNSDPDKTEYQAPYLISLYHDKKLIVEAPLVAESPRDAREKLFDLVDSVVFAKNCDILVRELAEDQDGKSCYKLVLHHIV